MTSLNKDKKEGIFNPPLLPLPPTIISNLHPPPLKMLRGFARQKILERLFLNAKIMILSQPPLKTFFFK